MRVLVTGGTGYVGSAVVGALAEAGHDVAVWGRSNASERLPEVDVVCHLAALTKVRESIAEPERYHEVNVEGTLRLLRALPAARFVLASTSAVYGVPKSQPIDEDAVLSPLNPYGATKAAAERAVLERSGTVLRIFNVAGAANGRGDHDLSRIVPKAVAVAAGVEPALGINGDGSAVRDFVHVGDVADAFVRATERDAGGVFNIGATKASVADVVAATERVSGRPVRLEHRPANPGEAPVIYADATRARIGLGWNLISSSLEQMVSDQWATQVR